jgi:hypothetical protein
MAVSLDHPRCQTLVGRNKRKRIAPAALIAPYGAKGGTANLSGSF